MTSNSEVPGFNLKTLWKWLIIACAFLLFAITIYTFWPYWVAANAMQTFCAGVAPGSTLADVQSKAVAYDYSVTPMPDGSALVSDPVSFGRLKCSVRFNAGTVVSAEYSGNY